MMRGRDQQTGRFLGPSRSQRRRQALDILALAQRLSELSEAALQQAQTPASLLPHLAELKRISAHGARKRQLAYIAKLLRNEDGERLDAINDALRAGGEAARRDTARLHQAEAWRARLLSEGDAALAELLERCPAADRRHLRQLLRKARQEHDAGKPPRALRALFQAIREALDAAPSDTTDNAAVAADD